MKNYDFCDLYQDKGPAAVRKAIENSCKSVDYDGIPPKFHVNNKGLYKDIEKDNLIVPIRIGDWITVKARVPLGRSGKWGKLVAWKDCDGNPVEDVITQEELYGKSDLWLQKTAGTSYNMDALQVTNLKQYLSLAAPSRRANLISKPGWYEDVYAVNRDLVIRALSEDVIASFRSTCNEKGSLEDWKLYVATLTRGNPIQTIVLCNALAAPLLEPANQESGGLHLVGNSSCGKSTSLKFAQSVWDYKQQLDTWRATDNALEFVARAHNDGLLIRDESGEAKPQTLDAGIYMLSDNRGKDRAHSGSNGVQAKDPLTWRVCVLSSGEEDIETRLKSAGIQIKAGQRVRLPGIRVTPNDLQDLHGFQTPADFIAEAEKNFAQYYGTAGPEFVRYVVANLKLLRNKLPSLVNEQAAVLCRSIEPCDPQIRRVAKKFALYQIAGHLASVWGVLPHTEAEIDQAVEVCFDRWLSRWGGTTSSEEAEVLEKVRSYVVVNQRNFIPNKFGYDGPMPSTCAGYIEYREEDSEFYFFTTFFKDVVLKGLDIEYAVDVLIKNKYLIPGRTKAKGKKGQAKHSVYTWDGERLSCDKSIWFYHIVIPEMRILRPQEPIPPQTSVSVSVEDTDVDFDI